MFSDGRKNRKIPSDDQDLTFLGASLFGAVVTGIVRFAMESVRIYSTYDGFTLIISIGFGPVRHAEVWLVNVSKWQHHVRAPCAVGSFSIDCPSNY